MKHTQDQPLDCQTVREELPALLYDDLDETTRRRVETHVASCESCRAELEAHSQTTQLLDRWTDASVQSVAPTRAVWSHQRVRLGWIRPVLVGAVAAIVIFAVLGLIGADLQFADGQVIVSLGRGTGHMAASERDFEAIAPELRTLAREEIDSYDGALSQALEASLFELSQEEEGRRILLAQAVDLRRDEDLRRQDVVIRALVEHIQNEAVRTRGALDDIRTWIAMNDPVDRSTDNLN